jgi:hypothetical protein
MSGKRMSSLCRHSSSNISPSSKLCQPHTNMK